MEPLPTPDHWYFVMRLYSHTDKRYLWKVESRRFREQLKADDWKDFLHEQNPKHTYFVITMSAAEAQATFHWE